ncbi:hypothetical protein BOTU111921_10455 [Bordetella tumbae]
MKLVLTVYALILALCMLATVSGVYVLWGTGWALLSLGGFLMWLSEILRRGLKEMKGGN